MQISLISDQKASGLAPNNIFKVSAKLSAFCQINQILFNFK